MQKTKEALAVFIIAVIIGAGALTYYFQFSKKTVVDPNTLMVGTTANFQPFIFMKDGQIVGFEIDLMNAITEKLGKKIVFKDMDFDSILIEAQFGRINVIAAAMTPTPEREKLVSFTTPYLTNDPYLIITLAPLSVQTLADLAGKEVIVNDGYTAETFMSKQENITLKRIPSPAEAFLALQSGRGYAYVTAQSIAQPFFAQYGTQNFNILKLADGDSYALAVPKAFPEIFEQIQNSLTTLQQDGTLESLKKKWHLNF